METKVALLPSRPAPQVLSGGQSWFGSDDEFVGRNPDDSASINYWLQRRHLFGDLKIEVYDADGELITTLPGKKRRGMNRVGWPMRLKAPTMPPATPSYLARFARQAAALGANLVGGCCGTTPQHITAMRTALERTPAVTRA